MRFNYYKQYTAAVAANNRSNPPPLPPKHHGHRADTGGEGQKRGEQQYAIGCVGTPPPPSPPACAPPLSAVGFSVRPSATPRDLIGHRIAAAVVRGLPEHTSVYVSAAVQLERRRLERHSHCRSHLGPSSCCQQHHQGAYKPAPTYPPPGLCMLKACSTTKVRRR